MWGSRISLKKLIAVCRSLAMTLHSGLPVHRAFDLTARKIGDARCRRELGEVTREIMEGQDVATALRHRDGYFPDLFLDLVDVSEQSGAMPEVLKALAEHYEDLQRLRRSFLGQIIFPILQLVAAILIVALLIFVLGLIASGRANGVEDMLGLGLTGTSGAITWLVLSFGSLGAVFAAYWVVSKVFQQQRALDTILLAVPVIGPCMRSFALARFSWAYALTQQTGMSVQKCLQASFRATGNGAFMAAAPAVIQWIEEGDELHQALRSSGIFPEDYLQMVEMGEHSGTVPESLQRLSPELEEQAQRSLKILAEVAGYVIWAIVAGLIIFVIFSIFSKYVAMLNQAGNF